jgi:succinate dehydrogenase/fumarate reductase cytochrome b subunit
VTDEGGGTMAAATSAWRRPARRLSTGAVAWVVQRATAWLLTVLVPVQVWSGLAAVGKLPGGPLLRRLHVAPWWDGLLVFAVAFHLLYGVRVMLVELGAARWADLLFGVFAFLGTAAVVATVIVLS